MNPTEPLVEWINLPLEPLMRVFSFLSPAQVCLCASVCTIYNEWLCSNEVWKPHCSRLSLLSKDAEPMEVEFKTVYQTWYGKFGFCPEQRYTEMENLFTRLQLWSKKMGISFDLQPAPAVESVIQVETLLSDLLKQPFTFPDDLRCFYLMTSGQLPNKGYGLMGGYSFYHDHVNMFILPLPSIPQQAKRFPSSSLIPLCFSPHSYKTYFLVPFDTGDLKRGMIIESGSNSVEWVVATSFSALLHERTNGYEQGIYSVQPHFISLFPTNTETVTTEGVTIKAAPLFIAEKSNRRSNQYMWAYSIHMSMAADESDTKNCQLQTRHWDIYSFGNDRPSVVDGPGVIGAYPKMFPGAVFSYESCCPLQTPTGHMGGSFQMKRKDGVIFDAVVPTFHFRIPSIITYPDEAKK